MPLARIDDVVATVVAKLQATCPGVTVVEADVVDLPPGGPSERTVYVLPAGYGQAEMADRKTEVVDYRVSVVVYDRTDPPVTADWRTGLTAFVEQQVYQPLQDARVRPYLLDDSLLPYAAQVVEVYDPTELMEGRFFSELLFTFRMYAES